MSRALVLPLLVLIFASGSLSAQEGDPRERIRKRIQALVDDRVADLKAELTALIDRELAAARPSGGRVAELEKAVGDLRAAVDRLAREVHALGGHGHDHGPAKAPTATGSGGWLGVDLAELPGGAHGAHVLRVLPGGPAAKAGLESGDVIVRVAGVPVKTVREASERSGSFAPGTAILLGVRRGPFALELVVTLGSRPDKATLEKLRAQASAATKPERPTSDAGMQGWMGVQLANLPGKAHGAHVASVQPNSPAERAGLQPGDVIIRIAGMPVETVAEAIERTSSFHSGTAVIVVARRGPFEVSLVVTLGGRKEEGGK